MIEIRPMTKNDLEEVAEIEKACFSTPWSKEALKKEIKNKFARYVVAKIDGKIIGYGGLWLIIDEGHITNIAVLKEFRKKDVGSHILEALIEICKKRNISSMTLEVRVSNRSARKLYEKYGFQEVGIRPKYYSDNNEDALILWLTFKDNSQ